MKKKLILIFAAGIIFGCLIPFKKINITKEIIFNKFDDTRKHKWDKDFKKISIVSSFDSSRSMILIIYILISGVLIIDLKHVVVI